MSPEQNLRYSRHTFGYDFISNVLAHNNQIATSLVAAGDRFVPNSALSLTGPTYQVPEPHLLGPWIVPDQERVRVLHGAGYHPWRPTIITLAVSGNAFARLELHENPWSPAGVHRKCVDACDLRTTLPHYVPKLDYVGVSLLHRMKC